MPHCIIEYPQKFESSLQVEKLCRELHLVMINSGLFQPESIKTRVIPYKYISIGKSGEEQPFIHTNVALMSGRTADSKKALSQAIYNKTKEICPDLYRISVEIRDMDKDSYTVNNYL